MNHSLPVFCPRLVVVFSPAVFSIGVQIQHLSGDVDVQTIVDYWGEKNQDKRKVFSLYQSKVFNIDMDWWSAVEAYNIINLKVTDRQYEVLTIFTDMPAPLSPISQPLKEKYRWQKKWLYIKMINLVLSLAYTLFQSREFGKLMDKSLESWQLSLQKVKVIYLVFSNCLEKAYAVTHDFAPGFAPYVPS